jgi:hypothetical protein
MPLAQAHHSFTAATRTRSPPTSTLLRIAIGSHHLERHYFYARFFINGTIGAGAVTSIASMGSFN